MPEIVVLIQVLVAIAMFDVWLLRYDKPVRARGGDARTMPEEFRVYGLPDWTLKLVRVSKLGAGALLLIGIWVPLAAAIGGAMLVVLMAGAISMHVKVGDPVLKSVPATFFFLLSAYVLYVYRGQFLG